MSAPWNAQGQQDQGAPQGWNPAGGTPQGAPQGFYQQGPPQDQNAQQGWGQPQGQPQGWAPQQGGQGWGQQAPTEPAKAVEKVEVDTSAPGVLVQVSPDNRDKLSEDKGAAVLIRAIEHIPSTPVQGQNKEAINAEWVVLDGPNAGARRGPNYILNGSIIRKIKDAISANGGHLPLLYGRVGEKPSGKGNPSLILQELPEGDPAIAQATSAAQHFGWIPA